MAKRRSNGEGSVFKHKASGRWTASLVVGRDERGKLVRKYLYGATQREVREKLDRLREQSNSGAISTKTGKMTLSEWLDVWLESDVKGVLADSTFDHYEGTSRLWIKPFIGQIPVTKLTHEHIDKLTLDLRRKQKSNRQLQKVYAVLRRSLNIAVKRGVIQFNPIDRATPQIYRAPEAKYLTQTQVDRLVEVASTHRYGEVVLLAIATGFRLGEILGLQWGDIDFDRNTITVRRAQKERHGEVSFSQPKTKKSRRTVSVDDELCDVLKAMKPAESDDADLVFIAPRGGPLRRSNFRERFWFPMLEEAGVPRERIHALRHTSATLLLSAGVHPKIAQERLGHASIDTTLNVYSHVIEGMDVEAAKILGRAIKVKKRDDQERDSTV